MPRSTKSRTRWVSVTTSDHEATGSFFFQHIGAPVAWLVLELDSYEDRSVIIDHGEVSRKCPTRWKPALRAAEVEPTRENGMHALRRHYASVLLHAGESIKAVSEYLGHADAGFTLRTYTHLTPESDQRTRNAVDQAFACNMGATSATEIDAAQA